MIIAIIGAIAAPRIIEYMNQEETAGEAVNVVTIGGQQIMQGDLSNEVELIGSTGAKESAQVIAMMPAEVEELKVVAGDYVEEGDVLFILDTESVEDQVIQAEIGLTLAKVGVKNAEAGISQAQLGYDLAKSNYNMQYDSYEFGSANVEKYTKLFEEGVVSEMELEQMKLQASPETVALLEKQLAQAASSISMSKLGVESAEAQLLQAQEGYDSAVELLEDMTVTAPISGYVAMNYITEGGMATNTSPAMQIDDISEIIVSASVTESLINGLEIGEKVSVIIGALDGQVFEGVIDQTSTAADMRTLLYPIKIRVTNTDDAIKPGMFATVLIETEKSTDALYVPSEAVILREGIRYVYLLRGDDAVERVEVQVGIDNGFNTEIIEGVTAEDIVVTKGIGLIDENSTVKLIRSDV